MKRKEIPITCLLDSKICRVFQIIGCKQSRQVNIFALGDKYKIKKKHVLSWYRNGNSFYIECHILQNSSCVSSCDSTEILYLQILHF